MEIDGICNNIHEAYCAVSRTACDEQKVEGVGIRDAVVQQVFFLLTIDISWQLSRKFFLFKFATK